MGLVGEETGGVGAGGGGSWRIREQKRNAVDSKCKEIEYSTITFFNCKFNIHRLAAAAYGLCNV